MLKQKLALKEDRWLEILEMEESINIDWNKYNNLIYSNCEQ